MSSNLDGAVVSFRAFRNNFYQVVAVFKVSSIEALKGKRFGTGKR